MTDSDSAHAREWLERQLSELGQLRNANRRDPAFKAWRQATVTVIQRVWPGDVSRVDRFRRIPFSPPMTRASDRQVREYYERGWGEAGVLLREYLEEVDLLGVSPPESLFDDDDFVPGPSIAPLPKREEPEPVSEEPPAPAAKAGEGEDDISRAMEKLLSSSPVFRGTPSQPRPSAAARVTQPAPAIVPPAPPIEPAKPAAPVKSAKPAPAVQSAKPAPAAESAKPAPATESAKPAPAAESANLARDLLRIAGELDDFDVPPAQVRIVREALLALARPPAEEAPDWSLLREAFHQASTTPALARRVVPLLLEFLDRAA